VTEHGRVIATIAPVSTGSATLDRLVAEGRATPATTAPDEFTALLDELRAEEPDLDNRATETLIRMREEDQR
jgi:antitoxin (DNA-binding transcriptional repressor) of toxin-antitoxin stability system